MLAAAALTMFFVIPAFADKNCATGEFVGTYTSLTQSTDPINGVDPRNYIFQLTLHADGTVTQYWTGLPDYQINFGTGSINIGAWKCRDNGNLIVTFLSATYFPVQADPNTGIVPDVALSSHSRTTYVLNLNTNNMITRIKSATRVYAPGDDPTDPNAGTLRNLNLNQVVYKRLVATIDDIQAAPLPTPTPTP